MKTLIIIPSFIDGEKKSNLLKQSINGFKKLNYDILLVSHSVLPQEIINSVNYYIFDSDNTFNEVNFYKNYWWENSEYRFEINGSPEDKSKDHAFPCLKLIRCSLALANYLEYDYVIFSDFDNYYDDDDLEKIKDIHKKVIENQKKFFAFYVDEPYPSWDIMFFITQPKFLLELTDYYFPKTIKKYNQLFTYRYPYGLENFYGELIKPFKNEGYLLSDSFHTYFNSKNLGRSNLTDFKNYIAHDSNENYFLIIILNTKLETYNIRIFKNDDFIEEISSSRNFEVIYKFKETCYLSIEIFDHENKFIKKENIYFNTEDKNKYQKNKITFLNH